MWWRPPISYFTILTLFKLTEGSWPDYPRYLPGGAACSDQHVTESLRGLAPCRTRDKVIAVPWPNNTDIQQLSPSHVVVRRCSGGCHGSRSCVAGATKVRSVSVMLARCPVAGGKCEKQCASLEVEDEVECQCGCSKHLEQECLAKVETHSWSRETCGCECRDEKERRSCLESPGKVWDSSSCSCVCPLSLQTCSSGLRLDLSSCSCLPDHLAGQIESRGAAREDRESQDISSLTTYLLSRWIEVLVIALLAFTAVLLAILCGVFLRRIHQLKTQLNNTRTSHVNVSPNLYSPCPVVSSQPPPHFSHGLGQTRTMKAADLEPHLHQGRPANKMYELYSSDSEVSSERQTDLSYYTDTSLTVTPPPCHCGTSECSTLLGRETNV